MASNKSASNKAAPLIIFTDLDGSLLDHHNYSFEPALEMLQHLRDLSIPVIFNSSKTFAEQLVLKQEIGNCYPFIAENGAAAYIPKNLFAEPSSELEDFGDYWVKAFCPPRQYWLETIKQECSDFIDDFTGFSEAATEAIMQWTGLPEKKAVQAADRHFSEPIRWHGSPERSNSFKNILQNKGARVLQGGRFMHVAGNSDKGKAMNWLSSFYYQRQGWKQPAVTLAIGDGPNDLDMLEAADRAIVIRSPVNPAPKLRTNDTNSIYTQDFGPHGWAQGVEQILKSLKTG